MKNNDCPIARSKWINGDIQTYAEHIYGVLKQASKNIESLRNFISNQEKGIQYQQIIHNAALYHDLGKLNKENQRVLHDDKKEGKLPINHRDAGVRFLLENGSENIEAALVYAHHYPGLPDFSKERSKNDPFRFEDAIEDTESNLSEYLKRHHELVDIEMAQISHVHKWKSMEYRMLLSCLVDADYTDASGNQEVMPKARWHERLNQLDQYIASLTKSDEDRNRLRTLFYHDSKGADTKHKIEYCDSPVGSGKTTAIMAHMLQAAQTHDLRHIIIVLPYTNIISQTVKVLRKAVVLEGEVAEEIVTEHHHEVMFTNSKYRHLAVTWTAPIIVTTAVQFFETLGSNQPSKLRKLCQLPGSAIIFDEYHAMLPLKFMPPAWAWINDLATNWGCHICLSSATANKLWDLDLFKPYTLQPVASLLKDETAQQLKAFEKKRVTLNFDWIKQGPFTLNEFIKQLDSYHGSKIVVFNTIQNAAYFADTMCKKGYDVLHLSSALSPEDRELVLEEIKRRLDPVNEYPQDWLLSATSCVECGMDFSFHYGFSELRSLQSAIQLCGRISRENEYQFAELIVFKIIDDHFTSNHQFQPEMDTFERMIKNTDLDIMQTTELVTASLEECYKLNGDSWKKLIKSEKLNEFKSFAEEFQVIDNDTISVVVNQKLANKIRSGKKVSSTEFQRGSVNMGKGKFRELGLSDIGDEIPMLDEAKYDSFLGYMKTLV